MNTLGIDLGASALKAVLVDEHGRLVETSRRAIVTHHPQPLWAEQNPMDWWRALDDCLIDLAARAPAAMRQVAMVGISAGAHIAVLCDDAGKPLAPSLLWSDQRAHDEAAHIRQSGLDQTIAGNRAQATWSLPQLMWIATHHPDLWHSCRRIFFAKDWLRHRLTGDYLTDPGDACGSLMADWRSAQWSQTLMQFLGQHRPQLGEIVASTQIAGSVRADLAERWGLPDAVAVIVGSIDTSTEWYCFNSSHRLCTSIKLASAGVVACLEENASPKPPLSLYPALGHSAEHNLFYYAAGMNQCASAFDWGKSLFAQGQDLSTLWAAIGEADAGTHNFYPYLMGERAPLWKPDLSASLVGLTRSSHSVSIMRAIAEGICFALREIYESYHGLNISLAPPIYMIGGGARQNVWCQILADCLGQPLLRPSQTDAAYGVARLAWTVLAPSQAISEDEHMTRFEPNPSAGMDARYHAWRQGRGALYPSLAPSDTHLF